MLRKARAAAVATWAFPFALGGTMSTTLDAGRKASPFGRFIRRIVRLSKDPFLFASILGIFALLAVFIIYPIAMVLLKSFASEEHPGLAVYVNLLSSSYVRQSLYNSLSMGAAAALVSSLVGFLFAYAVTRTDIPFKGFFNFMAIVPIVSPPFLGAVSVLLLFGSNGLITSKLLGIYNYPIYGFKGLLFAQVVTFFPVAYLTLKGVLESINPTLEDAALDLGSSRTQVFRKVTLPLALPGIASALLVIFIESLADFGNPLVLAGSDFPTLSVQDICRSPACMTCRAEPPFR
jgi:iron(III) transport system permease protein